MCSFHGSCFHCGRAGHKREVCKARRAEQLQTTNGGSRKPSHRGSGSGSGNGGGNLPTGRFTHALVTIGQPRRRVNQVGGETPYEIWCSDTGATCHMTNDDTYMTNFEEYDEVITSAFGNEARVLGYGSLELALFIPGYKYVVVNLTSVAYCPDLKINLLSGHSAALPNHVHVNTTRDHMT
ncbi:unnamed protein product, partial [Discosporangium mesarthrocarpum]